ncbi:MAG: FecR family protein [Rhodothermales bacterium]
MNDRDAAPSLPSDVRAGLAPPKARALEEAWRLAGHSAPYAPHPDATRKAATWAALSAATQNAPAPQRKERLAPQRPDVLSLRRTAARAGRPALALRARTPLAVAALVLIVGLGLWSLLRPTTLSAPYGETLTATLPDGSRAELNSGSTLTYAAAFDKAERRVRLRGEAFFSVERGERPFVVETANAEVTVLGTRFNVLAWPNLSADRTTVAVASGQVRVAARQGDAQAVTLGPGQQSVLAAGAVAPSLPQPLAAGEAAAWRSGTFAMTNRPLGAMFDEIERRFDVRIEANAAIRARRWTITKHPPITPGALLRDICVPNHLRYRPTANGFEVYEVAGEE